MLQDSNLIQVYNFRDPMRITKGVISKRKLRDSFRASDQYKPLSKLHETIFI